VMRPIPIHIAVEDSLSESVLRKILACSGRGYAVGSCFERGGFGYLKKNISGFNKAARGTPFLMLTDLDRGECAPTMIRKWLPIHPNLLFRVAVREIESWILASRSCVAEFLMISQEMIPANTDEIDDPKQLLVELARKSRRRNLREAIAPRRGSTAKVGPDYNGTLILFVEQFWTIDEAVKNSPSLRKTVNRIRNFQPAFDCQ